MKKPLIYSIIFSFLLTPLAYAATVGPAEVSGLPRSNSNEFFIDLDIEADSAGEITAEHGINLMFEPTLHLRWDKDITTLSAYGEAVDNGKVPATITPEYFHEQGAVHIPITADLDELESFSLSGLRLRTYDRDVSGRPLWVDIDGDFEADFESLFSFYVDESAGSTDYVGPWAPTDVEYEMVNGKPVITWTHPIDWDFAEIRVEKHSGDPLVLVSNTYAYISWESNPTFTDNYFDPDVDNKYVLAPYDNHNKRGEAVEVLIPVEEEVVEEPVEEEPAEEEPTEPADETEVEELSRLLNYYNVRYSIKCMPSGVEVAENDSACLWARIDLIYAQEITGDTLVSGVELSARDLELMETRRKWPELRYQENCEEASEPASYCPALGKALERISYFLD